ncbi:preprotein translocase subunit YajC [Crassaminicella thermophila]|uniref:Preprotein translocase subunit YajC n=1 Tax=Crassaminicella thermophila TaxID=2599308 RepID=A0A5C0SE72_CRATE|nr:preprotein translocase subunit YajC [Crassaminicella thermophila]QEK12066.1 preprotein translocase subunit YajC [Crassaminicella thermophila]
MNQLSSPIFMTAIFIAIFYFLIIRPQKKREKQIKDMRNSLKVGDNISTIGGIYGKIIKIKDDMIIIEVGADKTKLQIARWAVGNVIKSDDVK